MKSVNKNIKAALLKTTNSIKKKYKQFHINKQLNQENLKEFYKPVIESINTLHSNGRELSFDSERNHGTKKDKKRLGIISSTPQTKKKSVFFRNEDDSIESYQYSDDDDSQHEHDFEEQSRKKSILTDDESGQIRGKSILTDDSDTNTSTNITLDETAPNSPHIKHYLTKVVQAKSPKFDSVYGLRKNGNNYKIGNTDVKFDSGGDIVIKRRKYPFTKGLYDLLVYANPPPGYTKDDLAKYKQILNDTNAHKRNYEPGNVIRANSSHKYSKIIKPLYKSGKGLHDYLKFDEDSTNYTYWDDPNELVDRLRLLISSKSAGHTGHENEIVSIIEELREAKIIF